MYFPFLRGKQFELIALREIANILPNKNTISPIIEPVKKKTGTYTKTIGILQQNDINFTIIINPIVGDVQNNPEYICTNLLPFSYHNFQIGIIVRTETNLKSITKKLTELNLSDIPIVLILLTIDEEVLNYLLNFIEAHNINNIIIGSKIRDRRSILRKIRTLNNNLISLSDPFIKKSRNKDYAQLADEFFSEEHLYFSEEGFKGYSDLLTVGHEYSDKGYSPYAVAIHLTYLSKDENLRIHHFVSDSNEDTSDIAGKFAEALDKLIPFIDDAELNTLACNKFRELSNEGKYPGLGTVKKLSILNHLELISNYFSNK